jgi:hypothetical protein
MCRARFAFYPAARPYLDLLALVSPDLFGDLVITFSLNGIKRFGEFCIDVCYTAGKLPIFIDVGLID